MIDVSVPGCRGVSPLTARLEPWMSALCDRPDDLAVLIAEFGSPVNVLDPRPLARNAAEFQAAAAERGVELDVFFARKANKSLALVDAAHDLGLGIDLASEPELAQCLDRGVPGRRLMMTAAVKPAALLGACLDAGVTVALDNLDELELLRDVGAGAPATARVALRLAPTLDRPPTRFGFSLGECLRAGELLAREDRATVTGVHFHVDGYAAADRVDALGQAIELADGLRGQGHPIEFVDIGGGAPMRYLDSEAQWDAFWSSHRDGLLGRGEPLTFGGHRLGLDVAGGEVTGTPTVYPAFQRPVRGGWLGEVLDGRLASSSVADALRDRELCLRMEPGRSLLDGVGLTAATVAYRKQRPDGTWLVGLEMNRTQCRSAADDFCVDPLLVRPGAAGDATVAIEGYLVGAYCIERELLTWRRLRFERGVAVGDVVVFPNTAGYFMHILESSSHQMPLARNVVRADDDAFVLDPIDEHVQPLAGSRRPASYRPVS